MYTKKLWALILALLACSATALAQTSLVTPSQESLIIRFEPFKYVCFSDPKLSLGSVLGVSQLGDNGEQIKIFGLAQLKRENTRVKFQIAKLNLSNSFLRRLRSDSAKQRLSINKDKIKTLKLVLRVIKKGCKIIGNPTPQGTPGGAEPSATATAMPSATSPSASATATSIPTNTAISTATRTNTPTRTSTPSRTNTPSRTPTPSATNNVNSTATNTPTRTATATASRTATTTSSPTITSTATRTPTGTILASATPTRTATSTITRTPTATSSATRTSTPSATRSATPSPTGAPANEFSGNPFSLAAYHENLTTRECRHLLNKVAFGGNSQLLNVCVQNGLSAVVDAMFNYSVTEQPYTDPHTGIVSGLTTDIPVYNRSDDTQPFIIGVGIAEFTAFKFWVHHITKGNPLKEYLTYLFTDWFAVNINAGFDGCQRYRCPNKYLSLYRDNVVNAATSDAESVEFAAPGSFERLLIKQNWDNAMLGWLNNDQNTRTTLNQNFGRELMELFALGTVDYISGAANYDQAGVEAMTASVTGYTNTWDSTSTGFNASRWEPGSKTLFADTPWAATAPFRYQSRYPGDSQTYNGAAEHMLYNNPNSGRYIAGQLFTRLVHPKLPRNSTSDVFINALAANLKNNAYRLVPFVRTLLKSEAMFSPEAYRPCVASPAETFIKMVRVMNLPVDERGSYTINPPYNLGYSNVPQKLFEAMSDSGDTLLQPNTIFGKELCGVWRGTTIQRGLKNLTAQWWLERGNGFADVLRYINDESVASGYDADSTPNFDYLSLMPSQNMTALQFIQHLENVLDVPLNDAQRNRMLQYAGAFSTAAEKTTKIQGLLWLFFQHPEFNMR